MLKSFRDVYEMKRERWMRFSASGMFIYPMINILISPTQQVFLFKNSDRPLFRCQIFSELD